MVVLKVRANIDMSANIVKLRPRRQMMRHDYLPVSVERGEEDPSDLESDQCTPDKRVSLMRIYLLSVVNFGISAAWSLEMAVTTPYFASALKSGPVLSHVVWVLGPISGLVMAPLVGYMSDRCTSRYGRRRPFVIAGAVGTFAGMMLFPHAREIAARLFSAELKHRATLVVAVLSFALMDFSINTTMFPGMYARAHLRCCSRDANAPSQCVHFRATSCLNISSTRYRARRWSWVHSATYV